MNNSLPPINYFNFIFDKLDNFNYEYHQKNSNKHWIKSYNQIKGKDWPECTSVKDFRNFPQAVKEECEKFKLNPTNWIPKFTKITDIDKQHLINHFNQIIWPNLEHINNKKIVDFACNMGQLSAMCLYNNCQSVIASDIRQQNVDIVSESIKKFTAFKNIKTVIADLHDYKNNTELCYKCDTVLLCGVMYHVHDHYAILESIADANPNCIIIETSDEFTITDPDKAIINWIEEKSSNLLSGWHKGNKTVLAGFPNEAWFRLSATMIGYTITKVTKHNVNLNGIDIPRAIYVLVKSKEQK